MSAHLPASCAAASLTHTTARHTRRTHHRTRRSGRAYPGLVVLGQRRRAGEGGASGRRLNVQEVPIVAYCVGEYVTPNTYEIITGTCSARKKGDTPSQQRC
jgi:hypothetical protein